MKKISWRFSVRLALILALYGWGGAVPWSCDQVTPLAFADEIPSASADERAATEKAPRETFWVEANTGMEFVWVAGGCYEMGDIFQKGRRNERPAHKVCVDGFYLGKFEVTLGQWLELAENSAWNFRKGDNSPVEGVSWLEAQDYIESLNALTGYLFRLPTEAEWEYAARSGGLDEIYAGGNEVDAFAWYGNKGGGSTRPVGTKQPNGLGLYDLSGNVSEWVQDWYGEEFYKNSPEKNPTGPESGDYRVIRGGGGVVRPYRVRTTFRDWVAPDTHLKYLGLRLVVNPVQQKKKGKRIWVKGGDY